VENQVGKPPVENHPVENHPAASHLVVENQKANPVSRLPSFLLI
jgi:hypothetical protein